MAMIDCRTLPVAAGGELSGAFGYATGRTDVYTPVRGRVTVIFCKKSHSCKSRAVSSSYTPLQLFSGLSFTTTVSGRRQVAAIRNHNTNKSRRRLCIIFSGYERMDESPLPAGTAAVDGLSAGEPRVGNLSGRCSRAGDVGLAPRLRFALANDGLRTLVACALCVLTLMFRNSISCSCAAVGVSDTVPGAAVHTSYG